MVLSKTRRFIFFANGKRATTSIERILLEYQEGEHLNLESHGLYTKGHIPPVDLKGLIDPAVWDDCFKFVFVRNPWDWVVSQYFYNFRNKQGECIPVDYCLNSQDVERLSDHLRQYRAVADTETLLQSSYAADSNGQVIVDFVGRFDQLSSDLEIISNRTGVAFDSIQTLNSTERFEFWRHLSADAVETVAEIWKSDIELFDYANPTSNSHEK